MNWLLGVAAGLLYGVPLSSESAVLGALALSLVAVSWIAVIMVMDIRKAPREGE